VLTGCPVMHFHSGPPIHLLSGVDTLSGWQDAVLAAGEAALTSRVATGEELESERLKAKLGAALIERDLLNEKIALLEAGRPFASKLDALITKSA
jgi:hypothetical protein